LKKEAFSDTISSLLYILSALVITLGLSFMISSWLIQKNLGDIIHFFLASSFGSTDNFLRMLTRTTPLLITTLGLIIAFNSGIWNIGGEGQIIIGVIVSTGICLFLDLPPNSSIFLAFLTSFFVSGVYAAFAGFLKAKWNVNEVAITMMQNFVVIALLQWLIDDPWNWGVGLYPRTDMIPLETRLPFIYHSLNLTFFVGITLVILIHYMLNRTILGYELQAIGSNIKAAFSQGINTSKLITVSMLISGGICGLAGSSLVLGEYFRAQAGITSNYGFYAIAAALIADNKPMLAPIASLLISIICEGVLGLAALGLPHRLGQVIIGLIYIVIIFPKAMRWFRRSV
jgi:simple sugar transport system permease protein